MRMKLKQRQDDMNRNNVESGDSSGADTNTSPGAKKRRGHRAGRDRGRAGRMAKLFKSANERQDEAWLDEAVV